MRFLIMGGKYLANALEKAGHQVATVGPHGDLPLDHPTFSKRVLAKLKDAGFEPDILVYLDDGNLPMLLDPEAAPCPAIYYSIDTYCNPWHLPYGHGFDLVLVAQKDFVPLFVNDDQRALWFPLFNFQPWQPTGGARDIPVAFVGGIGHKNNPDRGPFFQRFRKLHPLVSLTGQYMPIFERSQIVLNQTAFSELNFRCFEAMGCGAALLMEQCGNGLEDIFTPGENILPPYPRGNAEAAAAIAKKYLAMPDRLADIARAGYELVASKHDGNARAAELIELAKGLLDKRVDRAALAPGRAPFTRAAFAIIGSELDSPQMAAHRDFYLKMGGARFE